jgi:dTDP-glucose pyrophosphorylase
MQPLAFSKELLPVGSRADGAAERPRAVSEYLVERMRRAGATRICFVISQGKSDIVEYFSDGLGYARACYVVQPSPEGLCDAIFRALPLIAPADDVLVGLPDTVWFPEDGLAKLPGGGLSFLCFPVDRPELFDAVLADEEGEVREIRVKDPNPGTRWVWGAFKLDGAVLRELHDLWISRGREDVYVGTLVTAWLRQGGTARAVRAGERYVDVGTVDGFREALRLLSEKR